MNAKLTLGTDSEVILTGVGGAISAIGKIGGNKRFPFIVDKGNLQEDNVLAEFAIDPVSTEEEWLSSIDTVMEALRAKVGPLELGIDISSSVEFGLDQLDTPEAMEFGCDPDFNAWTGRQNPRPDPMAVGRLRTCGGHVHLGFDVDSNDIMARPELIQWMDVCLGLPSVLLDNDVRRRSVYGKAGAYRPKSYGIEYRVLSNFWLKSDTLRKWVYRASHTAYERFQNQSVREYGNNMADMIQNAINTGDQKLAKRVMKILSVEVPS